MKTLWMSVCFLLSLVGSAHAKSMVIASKLFTESYLLAEMVAQLAETHENVEVERKFGLGQSDVAFTALQNGQIDIYPDYSDTIALVLLKKPNLTKFKDIQQAMKLQDVLMSDPLGFGNTYAIAVTQKTAQTYDLVNISDLKGLSSLRAAFSEGFLSREDTREFLPTYGLSFDDTSTINHALKYEALKNDKIQVSDLYTTDGNIIKMDLVVLDDDQDFFPRYKATYLMTSDFPKRFPKTYAQMKRQIIGKINAQTMTKLNAKVDVQNQAIHEVAGTFLFEDQYETVGSLFWQTLYKRTKEHVWMVLIVTIGCIAMGFLLGWWAYESKKASQSIMLMVGLIQTIPSLALLSMLIKPFGVGQTPAMIALFMYGLLPIVRNTFDGLRNIDGQYIESAMTLGLTRMQRMRYIELPLAMPYIFGGIKTSAIITIGTATLAALIGAGGYGVLIVEGLALNDTRLILQGAVPAAVLAIVVHGIFEGIERLWFPNHGSS